MTICLICHSIIKGQQFGTDCCRACAAFFRRTLQLNFSYKCNFGNDCDVTEKNRWSCRACRLKRCYAVGMGKFVSSSLREQDSDLSISDNSTEVDESHRSQNSQGSSFQEQATVDSELVKRNITRIFTGPNSLQFNHNFPLFLCQEAILAYEQHNKQWPKCSPNQLRYNSEFDMVKQMEYSIKEIEHVATFCMGLSHFVQLPLDQKGAIFKNFWMRFCEIDRCSVTCKLTGNNRLDNNFVFYDGLVVNIFSPNIPKMQEYSNAPPELIKRIMGKNQLLTKRVFRDPFKVFQPDMFEVIYLMLSVMWNVREYDGITNESISIGDSILKRINDELHAYYIFTKNSPNYAARLYKLKLLIISLNTCIELRKEEGFISKTFGIFKHDFHLTELRV